MEYAAAYREIEHVEVTPQSRSTLSLGARAAAEAGRVAAAASRPHHTTTHQGQGTPVHRRRMYRPGDRPNLALQAAGRPSIAWRQGW